MERLKLENMAIVLSLLFANSAHATDEINFNIVSRSFTSSGVDIGRIEHLFGIDVPTWHIDRVIPTNMAPTNKETNVASGILNRGLQSLVDSGEFKGTAIDAGSQALQKLQQDVRIDSGTSQHKVSMQLRPEQGRARIDYSSFADAQLSYQATSQELNLEIFKNLSDAAKIACNITNNPNDQREVVSLKINW